MKILKIYQQHCVTELITTVSQQGVNFFEKKIFLGFENYGKNKKNFLTDNMKMNFRNAGLKL
jgi:hypothetical protein